MIAILTMEYAASLGMENSMIDIVDLDDPDSNGGYLTPKAAEMNRSTTPLSQGSTDSCHNNEAFEKGELDVVVKRVESTHIYDSDVMPAYKMAAYPRGLALIIEIEQFMNDVEKPRIGSHVDTENLKKLFQQLHFKADHRKNLTRPQFLSVLRDFANNQEHRESDMMILAVLSHGRDGQIIASDGLVVETEDIYAKFNNSNCPLLQGKPKFFIVQACRGDDTDVSFPENVEMFSDLTPKRNLKRQRGDYDTVPIPTYGELNTARPTWEDMIIAYSTIPGFTSQRDHHSGTWFIQALVETFMNHAHDRELIDLLRMTSDYLSKFTNADGEKQTCNVEMRHLYKRIYFKPGIKGKDGRRISMDASKLSPQSLRRSLSTPPSSPARRIQNDE